MLFPLRLRLCRMGTRTMAAGGMYTGAAVDGDTECSCAAAAWGADQSKRVTRHSCWSSGMDDGDLLDAGSAYNMRLSLSH